MTTQQKRFGGLSKIHVAPLNIEGIFGTPTAIKGAKAVEGTLNYESIQFFADNKIDFQDFKFTGGEGTLTVSGLTPAEYKLLFGSQAINGGVVVNTGDVTPELALLFERDALGTNGKRLYAIYAVKFAQPSINATTMEGSIEEEPMELTFTIRELENGDLYGMVDTTDESVSATVIGEWYTTVQTSEMILEAIPTGE